MQESANQKMNKKNFNTTNSIQISVEFNIFNEERKKKIERRKKYQKQFFSHL